MFTKVLLSVAAVASMSLFSQASFSADVKCGASATNPDAECTGGTVCILVMDPPVCRPPVAAGSPCKRDKICASGKCEKPAGAEKGVCK